MKTYRLKEKSRQSSSWVWVLLGMFPLFLGSCSKNLEVPRLQGRPLGQVDPSSGRTAWGLEEIRGKRISEFTVVVFRSGITEQEWKSIFQLTDRLSFLRKELVHFRGRVLSESEREVFDALSLEVAEILITVEENYAAFLLNWGGEEACLFSDAESPSLECRLNSQAPVPVGVPRIDPEQSGDRMKGATLRFGLKSESDAARTQLGSFELLFKLRPEGQGRSRYFTGEAEVLPGSTFLLRGKTIDHYPYGYVEFRFE